MPAARPARLLALLLCAAAAALVLAGAPGTARADCQPDPAMTGDPVDCTAADADGFQAGVGVDMLDVTVETGATVDNADVAGTPALGLNDDNTVTVETGAAITADGAASHGIELGNGNTVTQSGVVTVLGDGAGGISGGDMNDVTNEGGINAGTPMTGTGAFGIRLGNDAIVTNAAGAEINVSGDDATGIQVGTGATITNEGEVNVGIIVDTDVAVGIEAGDGATVTNAGGATIFASGDDATGVRMGNGSGPDPMAPDFTNEGQITANAGQGAATGLEAGDDNYLLNQGNIDAFGNSMLGGSPVIGVQLGAGNTLENDGRIDANGADGQAIVVLGGGGPTTILNGPTGQIFTDPEDVMAGTSGGPAILGSAGVENVFNRGRIEGDVLLGDGADSLTLFTGSVTLGDLVGGAGTDALVLDGGGESTLLVDPISEFESLTIDAVESVDDGMGGTVDDFGIWAIRSEGAAIDLPGGLNLMNGTLQLQAPTVVGGMLDLGSPIQVTGGGDFVQGMGTTLLVPILGSANVAGALELDGGNIDLTASDDTLAIFQVTPIPTSTSFTILSTTGGSVLGAFDNEPEDTALLDFEVVYGATDVMLQVVRSSFASLAQTPNQQATGRYLDDVLATGGNGSSANAVLIELDGLSASELPRAYDQLHAEAYDAHTSAVATLGLSFARAAVQPRLLCKPAFFGLDPGPLRDVPCGRTGFTAWMQLLFSEYDRDPDQGFFHSDGSTRAIAGGFDWRPDRRVTLTGYIGLGSADLDVDGVGVGDVQSYELGVAARARLGGARIAGAFGYARGDHEQDRRVRFGTLSDNPEGEFNSNRVHGLLELAWLFEWLGFQLEPRAALDFAWIQEDAFDESSTFGVGLEVAERENTLVSTEFGGRLRYRHYQSPYKDEGLPYTQGTWTPEISAAWRSTWTGADREIESRLRDAGPSGDLTVESRDSEQGAAVGARLTFQPHGSGGSFSVGYDGFFGDESTVHRFDAKIEVYF